MSTKYIITMILSLAGLGIFGFPLVRYWYSGYNLMLLMATVIGLPLIGIITWWLKNHHKKIIKKAKAGQSKIGSPLVTAFIFFVVLFVVTMLFTSFPVSFFLAFVYATFTGGFAYWFLQIWLDIKKQDESEEKKQS